MHRIAKPIVARWSDWSGNGSEHLVLRQDIDRVVADSVFVSAGDHAYAVHYQITCDAAWRVRRAEIRAVGDERPLRLTADGAGHWFDEVGNALPHLDGAIDIDLSISPFTNTLPIRRLGLQPGQSAEIRAVYIRAPELSVTTDPQRYTCLVTPKRYRYESLDSDFVREIETDDDGLVLTYPGLFRRIL